MCTNLSKRIIAFLVCVLILSLVGDVSAVNVEWTDGGPTHLWSTATNWDIGTVPTSADNVSIKMLPGPTIVNEGAVARLVRAGYGATGELTVDSGTLTTNLMLQAGVHADGVGTININGGTTVVGTDLHVGQKGSGTFNMTGGTITVGGSFLIPSNTGTGHVNLTGGTITAKKLEMRKEAGSVGTMDIGAGTVIINGDAASTVQGYIDNGWITPYGGKGELQLDYNATNEGKTTLTAVHSLNPNPADGAVTSPGAVELSWTLPDPCVPGQPVMVDVYFTDDWAALYSFTDPAAIRIVDKQNVTSVVVQTKPKTQYYWAVDTYIGDPNDPMFGPIFSFFADNAAPEVDAGVDIATWLVDGVRTCNLDGTVTDDGAPNPYTVQWTVVSEPNEGAAAIETATAEDTTVTLSAAGEYVLQLEAFDGEYANTDTVQIIVYADACEHAKNQEGFEWIPGDINHDCIVNELDMAILEAHWLEWNYSTE